MIQAANVGVGISGKEGRQAVMAADYAIAQFRFLVPLLLVHGQWSYRRMCKLVLYSFWKNMLFAITNICFGFYSAFSAQTMYDSWVISFYNILFTGLPIFLVAAFDQPISRRQIMDYPPLYRNGIRHQSFSSFKYWQWQLWAVIQAVVVTMFSIAAFRNDILLGNGQTLDAFALGLEIMTVVVLVANAKIFLITNTWTVWNHLAVWGSLAAWFLFIILYAPVPTTNLLGPNLIGWVTYKAMASAFYWFGAILITACVVLPDLVYCEEDQRKMRRRERAKRMRSKLTNLVKRRRVIYTGFAFSQAPGVRDVMLTLGLAPVPTENTKEEAAKQKQRDASVAAAGVDEEDDVFDDTAADRRRGARDEESYHDDITTEHNHY
jgi:phospholipid-transporting ATPase